MVDCIQQPMAGGDGVKPCELTSLEMRVVTIMGQASVEGMYRCTCGTMSQCRDNINIGG